MRALLPLPLPLPLLAILLSLLTAGAVKRAEHRSRIGDGAQLASLEQVRPFASSSAPVLGVFDGSKIK
jgi:hypothetical protein